MNNQVEEHPRHEISPEGDALNSVEDQLAISEVLPNENPVLGCEAMEDFKIVGEMSEKDSEGGSEQLTNKDICDEMKTSASNDVTVNPLNFEVDLTTSIKQGKYKGIASLACYRDEADSDTWTSDNQSYSSSDTDSSSTSGESSSTSSVSSES